MEASASQLRLSRLGQGNVSILKTTTMRGKWQKFWSLAPLQVEKVELRLMLRLRLRLVNGQTNDQLGKWLMSGGSHPRVRHCFSALRLDSY